MNDTAYIRSSLYWTISRACLSDECRFLYIIYNLVIRRSLRASMFSRFSCTTVIPSLFHPFSLFLFHVRYVRNLAVANSCTNVNAGWDGFTNCFSLPPPTANPFYSSFLSSLSRTFSFLSLFLSLSLYFTSVYVATSRIAEIPHLFSFSGAVAGRAGRIARMRETAEGKNSGRWMRELRAYSQLLLI